MTETRYTRRGFGFRAEVHKDVEREFDSRLVKRLKEQENRLSAAQRTPLLPLRPVSTDEDNVAT